MAYTVLSFDVIVNAFTLYPSDKPIGLS
jgi:hypothetical protein